MLAAIAEAKGISLAELEIWFGDGRSHAIDRVGQKTKFTRRSAKRGSPPSAPTDQHTVSAYIYLAPSDLPRQCRGPGHAEVQHRSHEDHHLAEISRNVAPRHHAVLLLDQAEWHIAKHLVVRANITIIKLPPKCPELNPQENIWQYIRDNWLSNRTFTDHKNIVDHCCWAWKYLEDRPWTIMSIGLRGWAHGY